MIYLDLFLGFLKVGLFSFGGAYGAIPVIREVVMANNWVSEEKFAYLLAISESTPGPIIAARNRANFFIFSSSFFYFFVGTAGMVVLSTPLARS